MGEHKEEDDTVSYDEKPSAVAVSDGDLVASGGTEKSPAVDSVDSEVQRDFASADCEKISAVESVNSEVVVHGQGDCRVEGSLSKNEDREESGTTDGGDVMVGVVDSDINVNAVRDIGEESEGKLSQEVPTCAGSVEAGSGRDLRSMDGEDAAVDDSDSRVIMGAGVLALDLGTVRVDGVSSKVAEAEGGEVSDGGGSVSEQKNVPEVAASDVYAKSVGIGNEVDGSSVVEGSSGIGIQVKEVFSSGKEESLDRGGLVKEGVERGETSVVEHVDSREVRISEKGGQDQKVENEAAAVFDVETVVIAGSEHLNPKAEASGSGVVEQKPAADALEGIKANSETKKDGTPQIASNSLEEQAQITVEGRLASVDNNDVTCPNIEDPTKLGGGEVTTTESKMLLCSGKNEKIIEECSDRSTVHDSSVIVSNEDSGVGVKKQFICSEEASLQKEHQMTDAERQQNVKAVIGSTEKRNLCLDLENSSQSIVEEVVPGMNSMISSDNNSVTTSSTSATDVFGNNQPLNFEDCLDKSGARDSIQVGSSTGLGFKVKEPSSHTDLQGEAKEKIVEQILEVETFSQSSVIDTKAMHAGETAVAVSGKDQDEACIVVEMDKKIGHLVTGDEHADGKLLYLHEVDEEDQTSEEKSVKFEDLNPEMSPRVHQARYELPPEDESAFFVSDLVWGKVRSHPWWPGQIFDPCDASEKAMKYQKNDCVLVAYFGDRTFAWNEASLLKPFRSHFYQAEKQGSSEALQNAVNSALEEVSRRVELGLACSCIPSDIYNKIKFQIVENAGIREESSTVDAVDKTIGADLFDPYKLVEYVKALAIYPAGGADRLELVILKSQLTSFNRQKGYSEQAEFQFFEGLGNTDGVHLEEEATDLASSVHGDNRQIFPTQECVQTESSCNKRKHDLKDGIYPREKERSMSELMGESLDSVDDEIVSDGKGDGELVSPSSAKKQKVFHPFADDLSTPEGRKTISLAEVSASTPCSSKPSFKIGECISRVASQMTGASSILKGNNQKLDVNSDGLGGDGSDASFPHSEDAEIKRIVVSAEYSSLDELISQLHLAAQDPYKGYSFLNTITSFFSDFRNSVIMAQHDKVGGKRKKISNSFGGFSETFEFEDMSDTYWTDRVIQNGSEEQPSRKNQKKDNPFVPVILDKPPGRPTSRKRYSDGNYDVSAQKPVGYVDENAPAELVMHFPVVDSVPSESKLNKMFKHFGPINESGTEVDRDTNRARVIFKKCSDAEAAYGSAPKFNIFGSMLVNYQLNYTVSVPFKSPPSDISQFEEDATLFLEY